MLGLTGGGPGFTYHVDAIYAENLIAGGNALVLIGGTTRDYVTRFDDDIITNPKPSFSCRLTITSYG